LSARSARDWFQFALAATLAFRVWLSFALPFTGDEAYFVLWGRRPDLGFYDHPPMIGWLLAPLVALSDADWVARLPATLAPAAVALALRAALMRWFAKDDDTANLAAAAVLLAPINLWNVIVTTDAPLLAFSTASLLVFLRAVQRGAPWLFFASGVLLGAAFLSKYFAVLLGLAYLAWAVQARRWGAAGMVITGALPAALLNLYWNLDACWCNVMFNAINRHDDAGWSPTTPLLYAGALAYLAAPLLWFLWRERTQVLAAMSHDLKTPITRLRLRAELLEDAQLRAKFGNDLQEMEAMVASALDFLRGVDSGEAVRPLDVMALLDSLQADLRETGGAVTIEGRAASPYPGRPQALKRWWGPGGNDPVSSVELDLRAGGRYRILFGGPDGAAHEVQGVYQEVVPNRRLVFTWIWPRTTPERESLVTIEFRQVARGTQLVFRHERFVDETVRDNHRQGWSESFAKLERALQEI